MPRDLLDEQRPQGFHDEFVQRIVERHGTDDGGYLPIEKGGKIWTRLKSQRHSNFPAFCCSPAHSMLTSDRQ